MEILLPIKALTKVDLPTLGRPMTATKPQRKASVISLVLLGNGYRKGKLCGFARTGSTPAFGRRQRLDGSDGLLRRRLLSRPPAGTTGRHTDIQLRYPALNLEGLAMRCAMGGEHRIHGKIQLSPLQQFLKQGFGIFS